MWYFRKLPDGLTVLQTRPEHAQQLEELQRTCFPTLADAERFKAAHYLKHIDLFPDGQFVVLDGDRVVGATTTLRLHFDFDHVDHTFADLIQGGWLTSHEPGGDWLYGADVGIDPSYRRRGLATALYAARQETVWRLRLRGQVTAGMIRDYGAVKDRMSPDDYYRGVVADSPTPRSRCSSASASSRERCSPTTSTIRCATTTACCSSSRPSKRCEAHRGNTPCPTSV